MLKLIRKLCDISAIQMQRLKILQVLNWFWNCLYLIVV